MYSKLYENFNYTIDLNFIVSSYIREYDISKANINILLYYGAISQNKYNEYYNMDKKKREIQIGILQKDSKIAETLKNGFKEFRKRFFAANDIQDNEIISIKNDAIFVLNKVPIYTKFDNIQFLHKNTYTSFYKLPTNIECYYFYDKFHDIEKLDIKGININNLKLHENHFLEFLKVIFCSIECESILDTIEILKIFHNNYLNLKLEKEYYRDFNAKSRYLLQSNFKIYKYLFELEEISKEQLKDINIIYNLNVIRHLYRILTNIYFNRMKS